MKIVFITHPPFLTSASMPRFAAMLAVGMEERMHDVQIWSPSPWFYNLPFPRSLKKWLGYVDQYVIFNLILRYRVKRQPMDVLFVLVDHALGPWVPIVANRFHVIHCHDFLAQKSAMGLIKENRTGWTGRLYQRYIRHGYLSGRNFISVSKKTNEDLLSFHKGCEMNSFVVYNGLSKNYLTGATTSSSITNHASESKSGFILHVGGNQWYKNRVGVIQIYDSWRSRYSGRLPLYLVGAPPDKKLLLQYESSNYKDDIKFFTSLDDAEVKELYTNASVFLFPSLDEGFGWPIAEAMAAGALVITTNQAPMTEVCGEAGFKIPRKPDDSGDISSWLLESAYVLNSVLDLREDKKREAILAGLRNAKRFNPDLALTEIETIYLKLVNQSS